MNARKIVIFGLALVLVIGSLGGIVVALVTDDGSGSSSSPSSSSSTAPTTTTTRVEFSGEGAEAFCAADARLNAAIAAALPTTTDAAALQADYERRVDAVRQLEQVAPAEIKADITTVKVAYEALTPALAAVGYDMSKVPPVDRAALQTPDVVAAGQRLTQFDERVCNIARGG